MANKVHNNYKDIIGVYYVNYDSIINTLSCNIGGSNFMTQYYDINDYGNELGQREEIIFGNENRESPMFLSDKERNSYSNYKKYISENYGLPSFEDSSLLSGASNGYNIGVKRTFEIGESINTNKDTDTLLGNLSSTILGNIIMARNVRRETKGFPSITNINYFDKGRTDIEDSKGIESLDSAIGFSVSNGIPNFGIKNEFGFIGFGNTTVEYTYSSITQNYSLFDRWGELTNGEIALNSSPAYNSIQKSVVYGDNNSTLFMSADATVDMSQFLIHNLMFKNGYNSNETITTYFGMHGFDTSLEDSEAKNRYIIKTNSLQSITSSSPRINFHYDEGALESKNNTANGGTSHGTYVLGDIINGAYGKDLTYVTSNAFKKNRYDTIISKFATHHSDLRGHKNDRFEQFQSAVSKEFGMSHGRNLLKVEKNNGEVIGVDISGGNGYENPYCRVWTYHHQYSTLSNTIRPFMNASGECDDMSKKEVIAKYRNSFAKVSWKGEEDEFLERHIDSVLKSEGLDLLRDFGVLNKNNGLVNITPTSKNNDGEFAVKTKNCMFSIENLAWKDVYKAQTELSKEQTGPFGGRIMWFPPYGLTFSENVSSNWNPISFIGRGESMYTYSNTERSGNLSFIMLIDHPSLINEWRKEELGTTQDVDDIKSTEQKILRFFAGCEILNNFEEEKTDETTQEKKPEDTSAHVPQVGKFSFIVYYPNNYSGMDDKPEEAISYLLNGILYGESESSNYKLGYNILDYDYSLDDGKTFFECGYEMRGDSSGTSYGVSSELLLGSKFYSDSFVEKTPYNVNTHKVVYSQDLTIKENENDLTTIRFFAPWNETVKSAGENTPITDYEHSWGYRVDKNTYKQILNKQKGKYNNYTDGCSYGLNALGYEGAKEFFKDIWDDGPVYSFTDVVVALKPELKSTKALKGMFNEENVKSIEDYIKYGIAKVKVIGSASVQGNYKGSVVNSSKDAKADDQNNELSEERAKTIQGWIKNNLKQNNIEYTEITIAQRGEAINGGSIDSIDMKVQRSAIVEIYYDENITINARDGLTNYANATSATSANQINYREGSVNELLQDNNTEGILITSKTSKYQEIRYDNEAEFFKTLEIKDPFLHHRIVDKIKYFDPAFHSITPEGFGARLTFLHQCTRQGNTIGASDDTRQTATNLAFGRPPVCVLRIGDFYYTKIIINSLNISYENGNGIQWDLNQEGIGVMPMYAKIDINFKFIGGSDLQGPISRLQNALSFNYYANTRVYDNRSDRIDYNYVGEEKGNKGDIDKIRPWTPKMYN